MGIHIFSVKIFLYTLIEVYQKPFTRFFLEFRLLRVDKFFANRLIEFYVKIERTPMVVHKSIISVK